MISGSRPDIPSAAPTRAFSLLDRPVASVSVPWMYRPTMVTGLLSNRLRFGLIALFAALALVGAACSDSGSDEPASAANAPQGDAAADFTVMTLDGGGFTLSEHLTDDGRPVFLNMWASWCPPCKAEMPDINAASESHDEVKFVGVAVNDDPVASADFATSTGITYTIGFDADGTVADDYQVRGLPATYIISAEGIILERIFGAVSEADIDEKLAHWFS